jgi:glycosyltransferase involved in cell wall biosynthesis
MRLPSMSIVTPSFNQAQFLGQALASVHRQEYPGLEHVVVDGGSDDGSVEIIEAWQDSLSSWVSEPDDGQYDAINRGFAKTSGEVMAWLNSDDLYLPGALRLVGEVFAAFPEVEWLTSQYQIVWDEAGAARSCQALQGMSSKALLRGQYLTGGPWHAVGVVQQESTFWRRSLWERAGGCTESAMSYAADFDLWARFARTAELYTLAAPIGGFRRHAAQKTAQGVSAYFEEAQRSLTAYGHPSARRRDLLRRRLWNRATGGIQPAPASPLSDLVLGRRARHRCLSVVWSGEAWQVLSTYLV